MKKIILSALLFGVTIYASNINDSIITVLEPLTVTACDDKNELTFNDTLFEDECLGTPIQTKGPKTVTCLNMPDMSKFILSGNIYTAVYDKSIRSSGLDPVSMCTSNVSDLNSLFRNTDFNGDVSNWDTSNVTNMQFTFALNSNFNKNIGHWDTSNVINMFGIFYKSYSFNQELDNWNVSKVENMGHMFAYSNFNKDIKSWNVSNVSNMGSMFSFSKFNKNINNWNTSSIANEPLLFSYEGSLWSSNKPNFLKSIVNEK